MIWLDWLIVAVIALGTLNGFRRGFVRSLFGLVGLLAAMFVGWGYAPVLTEYTEQTWGWQTRLAEYLTANVQFPQEVGGILMPAAGFSELAGLLLTALSFAVVFIAVRIGVGVVAHILHSVVGWGLPGFINRLMGAVFGCFTWILGLSILLGLLLTASTSIPLLAGLAEAVEASDMSRDLIRIFYLMGPLRDYLLDQVGGLPRSISAWKGLMG